MRFVSKKVFNLIIVVILFLVMLAGLYLVKRVQETRRGAVGTGDLQLYFEAPTTTLSPGQETQVSLKMQNPGGERQIRGAEVVFEYDNSVFSIDRDSITCGSLMSASPIRVVSNNKVQIACYLPGTGDALSFASGQDIVFATFSLTANQGASPQTTSLSFVKNIIPEVATEVNLADAGAGMEFTIFSGGENAVVSFSISSVSEVSRGSTYTAYVDISNISNEVQAVQTAETRVGFDSNVFTINESSIECNSSEFNAIGAIVVQPNFFNLSCINYDSQDTVSLSPGESVSLGSFQLEVRSSGTQSFSTLSFINGKIPVPNSNTVLPVQLLNKTYTITDGTAPTLTPVPSGDNPVMNFKIKFDRVNWQIPDQKVLVKVVKSDFREEFGGVTVTSDEDGVLSGSLALVGVPTGGGYQIIIKGPKHLAEKFCADGQQGRCRWGQSMTIGKANNFDFTGLALEAGDIPDENGVQDGVVDAKDFSALKSALNSSDAVLRNRVNLDFDESTDGGAIIGGRDISLFLSTMSQRYDDDN